MLCLFINHLIKMSLTKSYVEKLIAVRDAYERERGPNDAMDDLIVKQLQLLVDSMVADVSWCHKQIADVSWCHEQLANEKRRTALHPESLVPSGIVEPRRSIDSQDDGFYDFFRVGRKPHNAEHRSRRPSGGRGHSKRGGKTRRHHNKKGKKSIRR